MFGHHQEHEEFDLKARHHCTDVPCCCLFMLSLVGFSGLYVWSMWEGNLGKMYHGINYEGQVCGVDEAVKDAPYLYWCTSSSQQGVLSVAQRKPICVSSCPGARSSFGATYDPEPDCARVTGAEGMASYKTMLVLDRYCLPDTTSYPKLANDLSNGELQDAGLNAMETLSSIPAAWPVLLGSFLFAILLGYMYLVLLRHCAEPLIWLSMLLCIVGFGFLGIYLWINAGDIATKLPSGAKMPEGVADNEAAWARGASLVSFGLVFVVVCLACCFKHSIAAAAACVEVACDVLFEMPSLLLTPVLKAFCKGAVTLLLIWGFLCCYTTRSISDGSDGNSRHFENDPAWTYRILFYMLMSFWIIAFLNAYYQFIVAYAVAEYYYTPYDHDNEKDVGCCSIWDGAFVGMFYHSGSLAFGSLLIATLQVFQKIIEYAEHKNKEAGDNHVVRCLLACTLCFVTCCKEFIETLNNNAYIDMAITSNNFCESARSALQMIAKMGGTMAILNGATYIFSFFGSMLISVGCAFFTYVVSSRGTFANQESRYHVDSPTAAMGVSCVIGLLVAFAFMNVFDVTSDTLLYCYGLDLDSKRGGYTAPPALKELFHGSEFGTQH